MQQLVCTLRLLPLPTQPLQEATGGGAEGVFPQCGKLLPYRFSGRCWAPSRLVCPDISPGR